MCQPGSHSQVCLLSVTPSLALDCSLASREGHQGIRSEMSLSFESPLA